MRGTKDIGSKLAILAKMRGATQSDLADACEVSRATINRFFTGKSELKTSDLLCLMNQLGIDIENEIDCKIKDHMDKKTESSKGIYNEISEMIRGFEPSVRKTLLEQIKWWADFSNNSLLNKSSQRISQYIKEMRV